MKPSLFLSSYNCTFENMNSGHAEKMRRNREVNLITSTILLESRKFN